MRENKKMFISILLIVVFTMLLSVHNISYAGIVREGLGTENLPFVLEFNGVGDIVEVKYKDKPNFWFEVVGTNANGVYSVYYTPEYNTVTFTLEDSTNEMYFLYDDVDDEYYYQAGVVALPSPDVKAPKEPANFVISTLEEIDDSKKAADVNDDTKKFFYKYNSWMLTLSGEFSPEETVIQNAGKVGNTILEQHPNYFIFTPWGSVKDLYGEHAKKLSLAYGDLHIYRDSENIAHYIINPENEFIESVDVSNRTSGEPPRVLVKFGKFTTANPGPTSKVLYSDDSEVGYTDNYALKVKYHFVGEKDDTDNEKAGIIETAITKLLLMVGMLFMLVIKVFLGSGLSLDSVIFNRYSDTIIDFRGRIGFLANQDVRKIINVMYEGFEQLAIIINVVILLYLGIQMVLNVGTEKQSKCFKNLQNWLVGIIILFIAPRFFPFITDISNAIVGYIGSAVTPHVTLYNVAAIVGDESILGEDADTAYIEEKVNSGITERNKTISDTQKKIDEYQTVSNEKYITIKQYEFIMNLSTQITATAMSFRNPNFDWQKYIDEHNFTKDIDEIKQYVDLNRETWNVINDQTFEEMLAKFDDKWVALRSMPQYPDCNCTNHTSSCVAVYPIDLAKEFFIEYKNLQLALGKAQSEMETLQAYLDTQDMMTEMRVQAGKTGRATYVIIWYLLIFQLISILTLYFKRIIMISILIMIFPIVMVTYTIDKINDGKAQTLETWFKEFTVNIFVQVAHAVIYVTLITTGLNIYKANPRNWLIFIIAVTSLFPMERLLRGIFGMNGGTIGQLKANVAAAGMVAGGAIKGAKALGTAAKGGARKFRSQAEQFKATREEIKEKGLKQTIKDHREKAKEESKKEYDSSKDKKRQSVADRKKRTRDSNIQLRREKMQNASGLKKAYYKSLNAASMVRNGMYHAGNLKRSIKGLARKPLLRNAGKAFKMAAGGLGKVGLKSAQFAGGALSAIQAGGNGKGIAGSVLEGAAAARVIGEISGKKKKQDASNMSKAKAKPNAGNGKNGATKTPSAKQRAANINSSRANNKAQKRKIKNVKRVNKQINVNRIPDNGSQSNNS